MFHCTYCYVEGNEIPNADLYAKINAADIVERDIETCDPSIAIFLSSQTDPYLYAEKKYRITRACIERVARHPRYRLSILTKSDLVVRDIDLLAKMDCVVQFSIAVIDSEIQQVVEPSAPPTAQRLDAIRRLESAGIRTSVRIKPILPFGLTNARSVVEMVAEVTSGQIVVQGVDMGLPYMTRMAELAFRYFPDKLAQWLDRPDEVRAERDALIEYLKRHERVRYDEIGEVYRLVQARFGRHDSPGIEAAQPAEEGEP
jgi:DNA repair photolyase